MKSFKLHFVITTDNNCPLYTKGELLTLSRKALLCPENKATCLILVREMTNLLFKYLDSRQNSKGNKVHSCSGCSGLIKFTDISEEDARREGLLDDSPSLNSKDVALLEEIKNYSLIQTIPPTEMARTVRWFRKEKLPADSTLIVKGQSSLYFYLILSGELVVSDNSLVIANLSSGDICGEMSYLGNDVAGADVRTVTETEVLSISGDAFSRLIDRIPELQLFMAKVLVKRLSVSNASHFDTLDVCMSGWLREMPPVELFQIFHMNKKTGVLSFEFPKGEASVSFKEGAVIKAKYGEKINQEAIFDMLKERKGRYIFTTGLSPEEQEATEIGNFMMLLLEGIKQVDESEER